MRELMLILRFKAWKGRTVDKIRKKFNWYEYKCSQCGSIYDRMTGCLLDGYSVYGDGEDGYVCKICKQRNHEMNDKLECPVCHKNELYTYDWDFLGEYAHYKCKNCKIIFLGSHDLWNYSRILFNGVANVVTGLDNIKPCLDRIQKEEGLNGR